MTRYILSNYRLITLAPLTPHILSTYKPWMFLNVCFCEYLHHSVLKNVAKILSKRVEAKRGLNVEWNVQKAHIVVMITCPQTFGFNPPFITEFT